MGRPDSLSVPKPGGLNCGVTPTQILGGEHSFVGAGIVWQQTTGQGLC